MRFQRLELRGFNQEAFLRRNEHRPEWAQGALACWAPEGWLPHIIFASLKVGIIHSINWRIYYPLVSYGDGEFRMLAGKEFKTCYGDQVPMLDPHGYDLHVAAAKRIAKSGRIAVNLHRNFRDHLDGWFNFVEWNAIDWDPANYTHSYMVYALLSHPEFLAALKGKFVVCYTSLGNKCIPAIDIFFENHGVRRIAFVEIPEEGLSNGKLGKYPVLDEPADVVFLGAGTAAPLFAAAFRDLHRCPIIDAGFMFHVWDRSRQMDERPFIGYDYASDSVRHHPCELRGPGANDQVRDVDREVQPDGHPGDLDRQ